MNLNPYRFQFSIMRLLACTTLVALAIWLIIAHPGIPASVPLPPGPKWTPGPPMWTFYQPLLVAALLGAAAGALAGGKKGAADGFKLGCLVAFYVTFAVFMTMLTYQIFFH